MNGNNRTRLEQQTIAMAGVAQSARLVDQISKTGSYPMEFLAPSVNSLFAFDAQSVEDVYGGIAGVKLGLNNLSSLLVSRQARSRQRRSPGRTASSSGSAGRC